MAETNQEAERLTAGPTVMPPALPSHPSRGRPPGPPSGAPLPPAAAPVQPQPPARSTGRSGEEGRKLCEPSVTEVTDLTGVSVLSVRAEPVVIALLSSNVRRLSVIVSLKACQLSVIESR